MEHIYPLKVRKKLIEIAIPLKSINEASVREKSIRYGHPSTLHLYWARRPLAAARAVLFCQLVDDPSDLIEEFPSKEEQDKEREKLFLLIENLVKWENISNEYFLNDARKIIKRSWERFCKDNENHPDSKDLFSPENMPSFHDPFAGGGALPLEAQRLGLKSVATDLNPVSVMINKGMIELPYQFKNYPPINPDLKKQKLLFQKNWKNSEGLAEDIKFYGNWMTNELNKRIGDFYPKLKINNLMVSSRPDLKPYLDKELKIICWIWARTVKSPDPFYSNVEVPLVGTFILSDKKGKEAYIKPIISGQEYTFEVKTGKPDDLKKAQSGTKVARGANFYCLMSGTLIDEKYIKKESMEGRLNCRLMAIVAEGDKSRVFLNPNEEHELLARKATPKWKPDIPMNRETSNLVSGRGYGFFVWSDIFTKRQLLALTTLSDLIKEVKSLVINHAEKNNFEAEANLSDQKELDPKKYAEAISLYLSFAIDKGANYWSAFCSWHKGRDTITSTFGRQALPMIWDFAEANPLSSSSGNFLSGVNQAAKLLEKLSISNEGEAFQANASTQSVSSQKIISTDPPYYDNIAYADLSDFFYIWMRVNLKDIYPDIFRTTTVPKIEELVATPYRHGGKQKAEEFFLGGMSKAMENIAKQSIDAYPITIYYAFKQSETKSEGGQASTGWETFLDAVINSGLSITGTWPLRTELVGNLKKNVSALASSILLVCKKRDPSSAIMSRSSFRKELRKELPKAINELEKANIAPVDLAQSAIGPGMKIFSKARAVLKADDSKMTIKEALIDINFALDDYLSESENQFDADTNFALTFFESFGFEKRPYGDAEGLAIARNISVAGIVKAGILKSVAGKVFLLKRDQLEKEWDPFQDQRLCVWEATHHLINRLELGGEISAAALLTKLKKIKNQDNFVPSCRSLAYRLYNFCEKNKFSEVAKSYNILIISWPELERISAEKDIETTIQSKLI
tara:strand:- start:202 stop:3111 length:2910 start_codon:yes stop_codon:yes gene_type:complete